MNICIVTFAGSPTAWLSPTEFERITHELQSLKLYEEKQVGEVRTASMSVCPLEVTNLYGGTTVIRVEMVTQVELSTPDTRAECARIRRLLKEEDQQSGGAW